MPHLDKKLVWQNSDGSISITHLHTDDMLPGETEDQFITRYTAKLRPRYDNDPVTVPELDIPADKSKRNEWSLNGKKVEVDQVKVDAKEAKEAERAAVLLKLGITEEELGKINGISLKG